MKKKHLLITTIILTFTLFSKAQTSLPYYSGFDNAQEQAGWQEYKLGVNSDPYVWNISNFVAFSDPACLEHNYPVGGTQQTDDWFVSPEFDFSDGATIDSLRYYFAGFGTPNNGDTIALYLLNGSGDPSQASSKMVLYNFTDSNYMNDNVWRKMDKVTISSTSGKSYLAFRYTTVANWLNVRLDNLSITSLGTNGKAEFKKVQIKIFPNPVGRLLNINFSNEMTLSEIAVMDFQGKVVKSLPVSENSMGVNIADLPSGIYFLQLTDTAGYRLTEKFIKE